SPRPSPRPKAQSPKPKAQGPRPPKAQGPKAQSPRPPKAQGPKPKAQGPRPKAAQSPRRRPKALPGRQRLEQKLLQERIRRGEQLRRGAFEVEASVVEHHEQHLPFDLGRLDELDVPVRLHGAMRR